MRDSFTSSKQITYIHPYTDNLLIGLGRDSTTKGLTALFIDVSNPRNIRPIDPPFTLSEEYVDSIA